MNFLMLFVILTSNGRVNTSFYTYHKVDAYSLSDFYLNYALRRYDFRLTLERRENDFGLKSITFEIDSAFGGYRLALGEKSYHVRGPVSSVLNIWGVAFTGRNIDFILGKERDRTLSLPPTFNDNKYTIGARFRSRISYRIPMDFYLLRRSENPSQSRVDYNNTLGVNSEIKLSDEASIGTQLWSSLSDLGLGGALAFSGRYTTQKYGGHCYVTAISDNYASLSSIKVQRGKWFRLTSYQRPLEWLGFSQDLAYSSFYDSRLMLNTRLMRAPFPTFIYSISFSRDLINQIINTEYYHKDFSVSGYYEWSQNKYAYGAKVAQQIQNCQIWSSFQSRDIDVWQFGFMFPFPRYFRCKVFLNYAAHATYNSQTTGFELSSTFMRDLKLHFTYEFAYHEVSSDHFLSLNVSKSFDFDRVGFSFVSGRVFMDVNSNGFYDAADKVVPDVLVVMDGKDEVKTDKNGHYAFSFVKSGKHAVGVNLGCIPAEIGTAQRRQSVDTRFMSRAQIDFPLEVLGSVGGTVYFDVNNNGQRDEDETGVPNVVLALNGYSTTSDREGRFRFANLASGTYVLEPRVLPPETVAARQELLYVYIVPGSHYSEHELGIIKEQRPINKKVFD